MDSVDDQTVDCLPLITWQLSSDHLCELFNLIIQVSVDLFEGLMGTFNLQVVGIYL